jgi:hypothetical protein
VPQAFHASRKRLSLATSLETAAFFGLLLLLIWAPLPFGSNRPWAVWILVAAVCLVACCWTVAWMLGAAPAGPGLRRGAVPLLLLGGWLLILAAQVVPLPMSLLSTLSRGAAEAYGGGYVGNGAAVGYLSVERQVTLRYLALSFALVLYFALLLQLVRNERRITWLCYTLVLSGTLQAMLGVWLYFTGARYLLFFEPIIHGLHLYPSGSFINRNHFGAYLEICLGLGIGLMVAQFSHSPLRTWRQRLRWLADLVLSSKARLRILLIIMVIGLILTRSRMGNGAMFAAILAGGVVGLLYSKVPPKALILFLLSLIALDVFVIGSWVGVDKVVERMQRTAISVGERNTAPAPGEATGDSFQERIGPGLGAVAALRDFPLFGTGGGTFYVAYPRYRAEMTRGFFDHAHLDYAEFASDGGVAGFLLLAAFALASLWTALWVLKTRSHPLYRGIAFGAFVGMVSIGLHSSVEFMLQIPAVAFAFITLCALPWIGRKEGRNGVSRGGRRAAGGVAGENRPPGFPVMKPL